MYEKISARPISQAQFRIRVLKHAAVVVGILLVSIIAGALGFILFEDRNLEDAIIHSAYILGGFGLVEPPTTFPGKLFAGLFGLYSSLIFVVVFSVMFAPVIHRILHKMHIEEEDGPDQPQA